MSKFVFGFPSDSTCMGRLLELLRLNNVTLLGETWIHADSTSLLQPVTFSHCKYTDICRLGVDCRGHMTSEHACKLRTFFHTGTQICVCFCIYHHVALFGITVNKGSLCWLMLSSQYDLLGDLSGVSTQSCLYLHLSCCWLPGSGGSYFLTD